MQHRRHLFILPLLAMLSLVLVLPSNTTHAANCDGIGVSGGPLPAGEYTLTDNCVLTSPLMINAGEVTINGGEFTIDAGGNGEAINVSNMITFNMIGGTITGATNGGVRNEGGTVNLQAVTITENTGGGLFNTGTMTIENATITLNRGANNADGGGIRNQGGIMEIIGSRIRGNQTTGAGRGGGIGNAASGQLTIKNSLLTNNGGDRGGAIFNNATIISTNNTYAANRGFRNPGFGNAIDNGSSGTVTLQNDLLWGNARLSNDTLRVQITNEGTVNLNSVAIEGGTSNIDGDGGISSNNLTHLTDSDNPFVDYQLLTGGDPAFGGDYRLVESALAINRGNNGLANVAGLTSDLDGETARILNGIVDTGAYELEICETATFPTTVANYAELRNAIHCANDNVTDDTITLTADITLTHILSTTNVANGLPNVESTITIDGGGFTIQRDPADDEEYRILTVSSGGTLNLSNVVIANTDTDTAGGAFHIRGVLNADNSTFINNSAFSGGAISFRGSGSGVISNSLFMANTANQHGSAIALRDNGGDITLTNLIISGNATGGSNYGAIGATSDFTGTVTATNITVGSNAGTGIQLDGGTFNLENSLIWGNSAGSIEFDNTANSLTVTSTGLEGGFASIGGSGTPVDGGANLTLFDTDPVFVDPIDVATVPSTAGDYHLSFNSVAINQGDNTLASNAGLTTDFEGDDRVLNGIVDLGADETDPCASITFPVTVSTASGLAQAVFCANENITDDTITLANDITLTGASAPGNGLPDITSAMTIDGAGFTLERDSASMDEFRIMTVNNGSDLTLTNITLQNGLISGDGGAITVNGGVPLTISNSIIRGNQATDGGAIYAVEANVNVTITNSTISGNYATNEGGAVVAVSDAEITLINTTVANNRADVNFDGVHNSSGTITVTNSYVDASSNVDISYSGYTTVSSNNDQGNNIFVPEGTALFVNSVDSSMAPTINGDYHLAVTAPIIDVGSNSIATNAGLTTDIDGDTRIINAVVDMGADEFITPETEIPVRTYPANTTSLTEENAFDWPRFTFRHTEGIEWYQVWVGLDDYSSNALFEWYPAFDDVTAATAGSGICDEATNICTIPADIWLVDGSYEWWITYWSPTTPDFNSYWNVTTFTVNFTAPTNTITFITPMDEGTYAELPSLIEWQRDTPTLWYQVWVGSADYTNQLYFDWLNATDSANCDEFSCVIDASAWTLADGDYEIWMEAWGPNGYITWTDFTNTPIAFTIDENTPAVPAVPRPAP